MASNASYYNNTYTVGAQQRWREILEQTREAAAATNKSRAEQRKEYSRMLKELDDQIGRSQTAAERMDIVHFRAHLSASEADARRARGRASAGAKVANELEKLKDKVAAATSRSLREAAVEAEVGKQLESARDDGVTPGLLRTITDNAGLLGILGQEGVDFAGIQGLTQQQLDDLGPLGQAKLAAISAGLEQGFMSGMSQGLRERPEDVPGLEASAAATAEQMTGMTPLASALPALAESASGYVVQEASSRRGGISDANIDAMLMESGLALDRAQRAADLESMRSERQLLARQAAMLPGEMTEDEILAQATERAGPIGSLSGEFGSGAIGAFRRRKAAFEKLKASRMTAEANQAIRDQISSLAPEQRVFMNAMAQANASYRRNPNELTGLEDYMDLAEQLERAKNNDESLKGDQVRLATLALDLAQQKNPDGSPEELQRDRNRILQAFGYRYLQGQTLKGTEPPQQAAEEDAAATTSERGDAETTPLENRPVLQAMLDSLPEDHPLRKEWADRLAPQDEGLTDVERKLKEAGATNLKAANPGDPYGSYGLFEDGTFGYIDPESGELVKVQANSTAGRAIGAVFAGTQAQAPTQAEEAPTEAPTSVEQLPYRRAQARRGEQFLAAIRHERKRLADGKISEDEYINFLTTAGGGLETWSGTDQRHWQDIAESFLPSNVEEWKEQRLEWREQRPQRLEEFREDLRNQPQREREEEEDNYFIHPNLF